MTGTSRSEEERKFTIHGSVFQHKPGFSSLTSVLHRVLPISAQRSFRDRGTFRRVADGGAMVTAALAAVMRPRLAARFLAVGRQREDHSYGSHPLQVIEVVHGVVANEKQTMRGKLIVFVHGGAWGSGRPWMYRIMVDRLCQLGYTVASLGYRVYPDADTRGQVDDLAAAMRWISANVGMLGFDTIPELYLAGHSSGAHIALLFLIRRAKEVALEDEKSVASDETKHEAGTSLEGDASVSGDGRDEGTQLKVEGFIGLAGVYDIHRHYLYESWRGVHEISPMKAANGGLLHELFDYSHPFLLGGKSRQPAKASSLAPSSLPPRSPDSEPPATGSTVGGIAPDARVPQTIDRGRSAEVHGEGGRWLGRLLPRCLLMHGMADATVPFAQTAAVAAALKALGVPTIVRFIPGGDHFGMVGQLMFEKESEVELAMSRFTTIAAAEEARRERTDTTASGTSPCPRPRL